MRQAREAFAECLPATHLRVGDKKTTINGKSVTGLIRQWTFGVA